jgi:hypothetical protein
MGKLLLVAIAAILLVPNFINRDLNDTPYYTPPYDGMEKYDPSLGHINNIDKLERYVDASAQKQQAAPNTVAYVVAMEDAIEKRFYHGFSHLTTGENWIAAVAEKLFGYGLSCKVAPADIMRNGNAACSQQSMVMMELLKRKGLSYRKVGFPHHYALEVRLNGSWYYFDPNMEPVMNAAERNAANWAHQADNLKKYYDAKRFSDLDYKFGVGQAVSIGHINEAQASNARLFQSVTGILSKTLWLVPLVLLAFQYRRKAAASRWQRPQKQKGLTPNQIAWFGRLGKNWAT